MKRFLLILVTIFVGLNVINACTMPRPTPPPRYWIERASRPTGGPTGIYFWIGLEVSFFQGTWPPVCGCAIKFPACIAFVLKFRLTWTERITHKHYLINFPLTKNDALRNTILGLPKAGTIGGSGNWAAFSGAVNQNDPSLQRPTAPGTWVLKLWFLVCTPIRLICPWVIFGAGGLNNGIFVAGHEFKFMKPIDPSFGGDPVINTFDGLRYEFQGLCSYILSMDCDEKFMTDKKNFNKFKVIGVNKPCDLGSCLGSVIIYVKNSQGHNVRIDFLPGYETLVNGTKISLEEKDYVFNGGKLSMIADEYVTAETSGAAIDDSFVAMFANVSQDSIRLDTDSKMAFIWNGVDNLRFVTKQIDMSTINTCGLAGDLDGDMKNDMRFPDGSIVPILPTEASNDLEESWIVQSFAHQWIDRQPQDPLNCKSSTPRKLCDGNEERRIMAQSLCKGFVGSYQLKPKCTIKDDDDAIHNLYTRCVHDMCFCYNDDIFACARYLYHALESRCH